MRLRIGAPRCLLVIAPHPDDETIGAHALMTRLRRRGTIVRVLVVTDGGASHQRSLQWPRARLTCERQRETQRAMRRIGIAAGDVTFLDLPDGELMTVAAIVSRRIQRAIRAAPKPLMLIGPAAGDDHLDHRVVAAGVSAARTAAFRSLAYPVWPAGRLMPRARALPLTSQERSAKRRAIRSYRTQMGKIIDDPAGFAMTPAQIAAFSRPVETFVEASR